MMPDRDGWPIIGSGSWPERVYHTCGAYVRNVPSARAEHLRECRRRERQEAAAAARKTRREATVRLRTVNRLRAEARQLEL